MSELPLLQDRIQTLVDEARDVDEAFHDFISIVRVGKVRRLRPKSPLDDVMEEMEGEKRPEFYDDWGWAPTPEQREHQRSIISRYEVWFSAASTLVYQHLAYRWDDFAIPYPYVKSILESEGTMPHPAGKRFDQEHRVQQHHRFSRSFDRQVDILLAIPEVVRTKALHLRKLVGNAVARAELDRAERLLEEGGDGVDALIRAAGVIAGVALERHLKLVADEYNNGCKASEDQIAYGDDDAIVEMARKLEQMNLLEPTDVGVLDRLHSIFHSCSHAPGGGVVAPAREDVVYLVAKAREYVNMELSD